MFSIRIISFNLLLLVVFNGQMKSSQMISTKIPKRLAIIGAGASGLISANILREYFEVSVYEKSDYIGGVWKSEETNSPVYKSLITNLPVEIMEIDINNPFGSFKTASTSFVRHKAVLSYLEDFAVRHSLQPLIRFSTEIDVIKEVDQKWLLRIKSVASKSTPVSFSEEIFDFVVVCNGHYSKPFTPVIEGFDYFKGISYHSIDYDRIDINLLENKRVLILGARSSATDIAREVSTIAKKVIVSDRNMKASHDFGKISHVTQVDKVSPDGHFILQDGTSIADVDAVIFCTGYLYDFPFLDSIESDESILNVDNGRAVQNVYQHIFLNENPSMAFVGLPWSVIPFYMFTLQAKYISSIFSGQKQLPHKAERDNWLSNRKQSLQRLGNFPDKYHYLGDDQWEYFRLLIELASGHLSTDEAMYINTCREIYNENKSNFPAYPGAPDLYRRRLFTVDRSDGSWHVAN